MKNATTYTKTRIAKAENGKDIKGEMTVTYNESNFEIEAKINNRYAKRKSSNMDRLAFETSLNEVSEWMENKMQELKHSAFVGIDELPIEDQLTVLGFLKVNK